MNSRINDEFRDRFRRLPPAIQSSARKAYQLWRQNSAHPSLQFKRIHGSEPIDSIRVALGWRALGLLDDDAITWFWIGSHADYDRRIR